MKVGLSSQEPVGDAPFDETIRLLSDDPCLPVRVRENGALRDTLLGLLLEHGEALEVARVRCTRGRLWVKCRVVTPIGILEQKGKGRGLISICAAGGQGVVAGRAEALSASSFVQSYVGTRELPITSRRAESKSITLCGTRPSRLRWGNLPVGTTLTCLAVSKSITDTASSPLRETKQ